MILNVPQIADALSGFIIAKPCKLQIVDFEANKSSAVEKQKPFNF